MIKKISLLLIPLILLSSLLLASPFVLAQSEDSTASSSIRSENIVTIPEGEVVDRDFYITAGEMVEIFGVVNGDLIAFGGQVLVDGSVNGDLLAAGGTVKITGQIGQDLRVVGGQVSVSGSVGRNAVVIGGNLDLERSAQLGGGLIIVGGNGNLLSPVNGQVLAMVGNLMVASDIQGDLETAVGNLRLTSGAVVGGNLTYNTDATVSLADDAVVQGETMEKEIFADLKDLDIDADVKVQPEGIFAAIAVFRFWKLFISFVSALVAGWLLLKYYPVYSLKAAQKLARQFWKSFGVGLLALVLVPVIALVLLISVLGAPLALVAFLGYLLLIYFAKILVALWLSYRLGGGKELSFMKFALSLLVLYVVFYIPVIGGITRLIVLVLGMGQILLLQKDLYQEARKAKLY